MIRENLRMGVSSIRRNPLRSTLSTLGVAIGIASVVAVASVADGLTQTVTAEFGDVGGGYIAVFWSPPRDDIVRRRAFLSLADGEAAFRGSPAVDAFDPVLSFRPEVRLYDEAMGLNANGVGPLHLEVAGKTLARGRFLTEEDMRRQTRAAVVGAEVWSELARELGGGFGGTSDPIGDPIGHPFGDPIGERLLVDGVLFTIVGVLEAKERGVLSSGDPNRMLLIPVTTAQYRFGQGPASPLQLGFRARSLAEVELAEEQIREALRRARDLPDNAEDDFQILSLDALLSSFRGILIGVVAVGTALAAISLLAGGVGVMNVMLVVVRERGREIGIRKAIGAGHSQVVTQFLIEAVLLSLAGGFLGAGVGAGLRLLAPAFLPALPVGPPPLVAFGVAFAFSVSVGVVFGIYPAVVAARREPWEALRSE